jgi:Gp37 protein
MTAAPYLDGPWTGETFSPPTPLDIATIEGAIVTQLRAAIGNIVEVIHFPDRPEAYEMRHRIGVAMVIYMGSDYGKILDTAHVVQERTMTFAVGVRIRDLGWAFGRPPSGTSPGAYQILEGIRIALTGFQPKTGCVPMHPASEKFIDRDKQGGVWVYEMHFATRTITVEAYQPPTFPLFIHGTAQEEEGVTAIQVAGSLLAFTGSPGVITLPQGNISGVIVQSANLITTFVVDTDYTVDTVNGIIARAITGSISANATVAVSYAYSDVVTALASGGNMPFAPNN